MSDGQNRKTGLGVDAFFPAEPKRETRQNPPTRQTRAASPKPKPKKVTSVKPKKEIVDEESPERRTAWLLEEHLIRLERLKLKERSRLRREKKRVSMTTLIDEAIEAYLKAKGA